MTKEIQIGILWRKVFIDLASSLTHSDEKEYTGRPDVEANIGDAWWWTSEKVKRFGTQSMIKNDVCHFYGMNIHWNIISC